eukprot:TRINITY_DN40909_c0_g2_i1.p1 TRINITY_DN40909_c0_g2~~TRINITY_DN40909_c0_g2_i1.p1  ORF type:complete len:113 (+),score=15.75 TRINITY_DN40909_c0_g2_i1:167-505(+)
MVSSSLLVLGSALATMPALTLKVMGFGAQRELGNIKLLGLVCAVLGLQHWTDVQHGYVAAMETSVYSRLFVGSVLVLYSRFGAANRSVLMLGATAVYSSYLSWQNLKLRSHL